MASPYVRGVGFWIIELVGHLGRSEVSAHGGYVTANATHGRPSVLVAAPRVATVDVVLHGELDFASAPAILQEVDRRIRRLRPTVVVVDLADVTHADSSALRM